MTIKQLNTFKTIVMHIVKGQNKLNYWDCQMEKYINQLTPEQLNMYKLIIEMDFHYKSYLLKLLQAEALSREKLNDNKTNL